MACGGKWGSDMKWFFPVILAMVFVIGLSFGLLLTPLIATEDGVGVAVWLEVAHRLCTSVGGMGTFVALIIVLRQFYLLRTQSELVQKNIVASMEGQLYARSFQSFANDLVARSAPQ